MTRRIDEFTGLRLVAVSMVVVGHCSPFLPVWSGALITPATGDTGVMIFFVLSGFLITTQLSGEFDATGKVDLLAFYQRRALRIFPAFYSFLAVMGVLAWLGVVDISWRQFAISGGFIWNYARLLGIESANFIHPAGNWYLGHTWSLALEEQFYFAWPGIFLLIRRRQLRRVMPGLIVAVPLIRLETYLAAPDLRPYLQAMFHTGIDPILIGCFVSLHQAKLSRRLQWFAVNRIWLGTGMVTVLVVLPHVQAVCGGWWIVCSGVSFEAALIGFLLLAIMAQPRLGLVRVLRTRIFLGGGKISYSLYLWQQLFTREDTVFLGFPLNLAAAVAAATASYLVIERPCLRLKDRLGKRAQYNDARITT